MRGAVLDGLVAQAASLRAQARRYREQAAIMTEQGERSTTLESKNVFVTAAMVSLCHSEALLNAAVDLEAQIDAAKVQS